MLTPEHTFRFLSTRESDHLIPDLVRYICCGFHPSAKLIQSSAVPRWAMLGWLIKCWYVHWELS